MEKKNNNKKISTQHCRRQKWFHLKSFFEFWFIYVRIVVNGHCFGGFFPVGHSMYVVRTNTWLYFVVRPIHFANQFVYKDCIACNLYLLVRRKNSFGLTINFSAMRLRLTAIGGTVALIYEYGQFLIVFSYIFALFFKPTGHKKPITKRINSKSERVIYYFIA